MAGVPEIVGAGDVTWIVNGASEALLVPSLTLMPMFANVPALVGVPLSWPVVVLNAAHDGLLVMLKVSVPPLGFVVAGVPEIVGTGAAATKIENAGSDAMRVPSETLITIPAKLPDAGAVPLSRPVVVLNDAHAGLFAMLKVSVPAPPTAVGWKLYA